MKKLLKTALVGLIAWGFTACGEDPVEIQEAPTFSATAANTSVKVGTTTDITVNISNAPGGIASVSATVEGNGTISGISAGDLVGQTSGTVTGTFTAGSTTGSATIVVTVTDQQDLALTATDVEVITVTALDPPSVTASANTASFAPGETLNLTMTFGAEAGLTSYAVSTGGTEVASGSLTGTSATETFMWEVPATEAAGSKEFSVSVVDANGTSNSTTETITISEATAEARFALAFTQWGNQAIDPGFDLAGGSITPGTNASTGAYMTENPFFTVTDYIGAVAPTGTPWFAENTWSFYAHLLGAIPDKTRPQGANTVVITDTDLNGNGTPDADETTGPENGPPVVFNWTKDNTYILDGFVFVDEGETLNIAAGTIIKGRDPQPGEDVAALIVARGGVLNATGTSMEPIIMTFEADPLDGSTSASVRGEWGGLIVLGRAGLNSANGTTAIEGIPTSEPRGLYGGNVDNDNSGVIRYVSIRHGGNEIGAGNEINGLTLGGVGSGTTIENVEVIGNLDDGIEWFGGTVNGKNLIVAFAGDDSFDYDEGYRGLNQFAIIHQEDINTAGDRGGEHDGGTDPETGTPYATPYFVNVTSIGEASNRAITFRDNAGGFYLNSVFVNYARGIDIENLATDQDSYQQFLDGNLQLWNNIFFNIGNGSTASELFTVTVP